MMSSLFFCVYIRTLIIQRLVIFIHALHDLTVFGV